MQGQLSPLSTWADEYIPFDAIYPEMVDENGVAVWRASWSRRREFLRDCADAIHPAYFRGLPALEFAQLIRDRCFPLSAGVRALEFVDHAPMPDALHDIWGHLPFLFDETY